MTSDEIVESLQPYGSVNLFQDERDKTWSASVYLFTHGCKTKVHSGFRHRSMQAALATVQEKVFQLVEPDDRDHRLEHTTARDER